MLTLYTEAQEKRIAKNITAAARDISKLSKQGYNYIYLASGFIAHYNYFGFMDYYRNGEFKRDLLMNARANQWDNFYPGDNDFEYYTQKVRIYKAILAGINSAAPVRIPAARIPAPVRVPIPAAPAAARIATAPDPVRYKVAFYFANQSGPSFNSLRFNTAAAANEHGRELLSRWILPTHYKVIEDK